MEVDDIISYHDLVTEEKSALQKGMNFDVGKKYSVFLMSLRENAPYADALANESELRSHPRGLMNLKRNRVILV